MPFIFHVVSTTYSLTCTYNPVCCKFDYGWESGCKYSQNNTNSSPGDPEDPQKLLRSECGERGSTSRGCHDGTHTVIVTRGHGMALCLGCICATSIWRFLTRGVFSGIYYSPDNSFILCPVILFVLKVATTLLKHFYKACKKDLPSGFKKSQQYTIFAAQEPQMTPVPSNLIPLCCKPTLIATAAATSQLWWLPAGHRHRLQRNHLTWHYHKPWSCLGLLMFWPSLEHGFQEIVPQAGHVLSAGSAQLCTRSRDLLLGRGKTRPGVPCTPALEMLWPLQANSLWTLLQSRAAPAPCACHLHLWIASQQSKPEKYWGCGSPYQKLMLYEEATASNPLREG